MYISLYVQTRQPDEARALLMEIISSTGRDVTTYTYEKNEHYWKNEGLMHIEVEFLLTPSLSKDERKCFLAKLSDKWIYLGNPVREDEVLASLTAEGCNYIKTGIEMINIIF